jgi:hypothetical protein
MNGEPTPQSSHEQTEHMDRLNVRLRERGQKPAEANRRHHGPDPVLRTAPQRKQPAADEPPADH